MIRELGMTTYMYYRLAFHLDVVVVSYVGLRYAVVNSDQRCYGCLPFRTVVTIDLCY